MNAKEQLAILMKNVAGGTTPPHRGVELAVQIFGDIYDEGRAVVVASLNPPKPDPKKCYCGMCGEGYISRKAQDDLAKYYHDISDYRGQLDRGDVIYALMYPDFVLGGEG